ncbi:MAG: hypothetical protein ACPHUL_00425 [Marinomonas gallaica]
MTKPCRDCQHYVKTPLVHYCNKKSMTTEVARITNTERADCWEVRRNKTKLLEVGK